MLLRHPFLYRFILQGCDPHFTPFLCWSQFRISHQISSFRHDYWTPCGWLTTLYAVGLALVSTDHCRSRIWRLGRHYLRVREPPLHLPLQVRIEPESLNSLDMPTVTLPLYYILSGTNYCRSLKSTVPSAVPSTVPSTCHQGSHRRSYRGE